MILFYYLIGVCRGRLQGNIRIEETPEAINAMIHAATRANNIRSNSSNSVVSSS